MTATLKDVAKSIWTADHGFDGGVAQARAAIEAMREPAPEMIEAMAKTIARHLGSQDSAWPMYTIAAKAIFKCGIDAVLNKPAAAEK